MPKGFRRLGLKVRPTGGSFIKYIYFRPQKKSDSDDDDDVKCTLFVTNLSAVSALAARREAFSVFSRFGDIEDVVLDNRPAVGCGRVTFSTPDSVRAAMEEPAATAESSTAVPYQDEHAPFPPTARVGGDNIATADGSRSGSSSSSGASGDDGGRPPRRSKLGGGGSGGRSRADDQASKAAVKRLVERHKAELPATEALQAACDKVMAMFERREAREAAKRAADRASGADDDGFVTVTHKRRQNASAAAAAQLGAGAGGGMGGGASVPRKRAKKKPVELTNFYAHQVREQKRDQLEELRRRFEEDKARIQKLKEARRFNPS